MFQKSRMTLVSVYYDESGSLFNGEELNWDILIVFRIIIDYNYFVKCIGDEFGIFQKTR